MTIGEIKIIFKADTFLRIESFKNTALNELSLGPQVYSVIDIIF